jgi:hypothetical protein
MNGFPGQRLIRHRAVVSTPSAALFVQVSEHLAVPTLIKCTFFFEDGFRREWTTR